MAIQNMSRCTAIFSSKYTSGRCLGVGATSNVFECFHRESNAKFAAKKTISHNIKHFNYYKKEEKYLSLVNNHDNIYSLHDVFYEENVSGKYIKHMITDCGDSTLDYIASRVYMNEDNLKHIVIQMLLSIMHCHNKNICHRDIKLDNFIYTNSYNLSHESPMFLNTLNIKLIDFGLATNYQKDYNLKGIVGTVSYVAPEIINCYSYTPKVDSWSLGVSIYKLIIKNPVIKHTKVTSFEPTYNNKNWKNYSDTCHDFVKQLLTPDYNKRMSIKDALKHDWITVS